LEALLSTDVAAAHALGEAALREYGDLPAEGREILALRYALARTHLRVGRHIDAAAALDDMQRAVEQTGEHQFVLRVLATRGATLPAVGRSIEGAIILEGVTRRAEQANLHDTADRARINLSVTLADDDLVAGRDVAVDGLSGAIRRGAASSAAFYAMNAAEYDLHLGNWDPGAARVREVLELGLEAIDRFNNLVQLFVIRAARGDFDEAILTELRSSASAPGELDDVEAWVGLLTGQPAVTIERALNLARADDLNAPFGCFRVSVAAGLSGDADAARMAADVLAANVRSGRWNEAIGLSVGAIAHALNGEADRARLEGRRAIELFDQLTARFDLALGALGIAAALGPDDPDWRLFADRAREIVESLGARPLLEHYGRSMEPSVPHGRERLTPGVGVTPP
jgi:hypothetical protein